MTLQNKIALVLSFVTVAVASEANPIIAKSIWDQTILIQPNVKELSITKLLQTEYIPIDIYYQQWQVEWALQYSDAGHESNI